MLRLLPVVSLLGSLQAASTTTVDGSYIVFGRDPLKPIQCLVDDVLHPLFISSAGNYNPDLVSVEVCSETCYKLKFAWAGLTQGRYCLCSSRSGLRSRETQGSCYMKCPTGGDAPCGGKNGEISVYDTEQYAASHHLIHQPGRHGIARPEPWSPTDTDSSIGRDMLPKFLSGAETSRLFDEL